VSFRRCFVSSGHLGGMSSRERTGVFPQFPQRIQKRLRDGLFHLDCTVNEIAKFKYRKGEIKGKRMRRLVDGAGRKL